MKLKKQLSFIVILLVIVLSAIFVSSFILTAHINKIYHNWNDTNQEVMAKNNTLFQIARHFGYGGFIHHFKNLVLRNEPEYFQLATTSKNATLEALEQYQQLAENEMELVLVEHLHEIVELYSQKMEKVRIAIETPNIDVQALDANVKVDDNKAIAALEILSLQIAQNNKTSIDDFNSELDHIIKINSFQLLIIIPVILIAGIYLSFYAYKVTSAYSELETIFNVSPDALIVLDRTGRIHRVNPRACEIFGYSNNEFLKLQIEELVPKSFRPNHATIRENFQASRNSRLSDSPHSEVQALHSSGDTFPVEITLASYGDKDSQKTIANIKDISRYKYLESLSTTDHLTGIANRLKLDAILNNEISRAERFEHTLPLIIIDIDHFKLVNDNYGHQEGDKVLKEFASLLKQEREK